MIRYLSFYNGKLFTSRPPADSDWVMELDIPDQTTLREIQKAAQHTYKAKKNRAVWGHRFLRLNDVLKPFMTGR